MIFIFALYYFYKNFKPIIFLNKKFSFFQEKDLTYYGLLNWPLHLVHTRSFPWNSVIEWHPIIHP